MGNGSWSTRRREILDAAQVQRATTSIQTPARAAIMLLPPDVRGPIGNLKGDINEGRVVEALNLAHRPRWLLHAHHGDKRDDALGIDVVVMTLDGPVPLQVKSSAEAARRFRKKRRDRGWPPVAVVIISDTDPPESILRKVIGVLRAAGVKSTLAHEEAR